MEAFNKIKGYIVGIGHFDINRSKVKIIGLLGLTAILIATSIGIATNKDMTNTKESEDAYSIIVNGAEVARLASQEEAEAVLEGVKKYYQTEGSTLVEADFKENIEIKPSLDEDSLESKIEILSKEDAITFIVTGNRQPKTYTVKGGDTVWDIAIANNLSPFELMEMNPGVEDKISIGQSLNLYQVNPYVTVTTKEIVVATKRIPYKVEYEKNPEMYKGQSQVKIAGDYGSMQVTSEVSKENGKIVVDTVLGEETIKEPSTQVTIIGTRTIPIKAGSGELMFPLAKVDISSSFGSRGGARHLGVDLRMPWGSSIMAADGGTVTKAAYSGSYGKLIVVNHGNGVETYYSHCSSINVSIGQNVKKGEVIGAVGSTGNSTGSHLHFEVRINGIAQNPMNYF